MLIKHDQERESMDESYTHYEVETYSRIQQNDYFNPIALEALEIRGFVDSL